jgi:exosortase/archaeosortase family protein
LAKPFLVEGSFYLLFLACIIQSGHQKAGKPRGEIEYICTRKQWGKRCNRKISMEIINTYKNKWLQIPGAIRRMVLLGTMLLVGWKALYIFWLEPDRLLDEPLTILVAKQTAGLMQLMWPEGKYRILNQEEFRGKDFSGRIQHLFIMKDGKPTISIADNCNGLELMVLYAAFIVCMPGKGSRKLTFILLGVPIIHLANLARCMGLVGMHLQWPGMFDFAHHYLFKIMVYGISFGLWALYLKPITAKHAKN